MFGVGDDDGKMGTRGGDAIMNRKARSGFTGYYGN